MLSFKNKRGGIITAYDNKKYVKMPVDMDNIKDTVIGGLTKRQLIFFGIGGALGAGAFFLTAKFFGITVGVAALGIVAFPAIFCGIYVKNGIPFEKNFMLMLRFFKSEKKRVYIARNAADYALLLNERRMLRRKLAGKLEIRRKGAKK